MKYMFVCVSLLSLIACQAPQIPVPQTAADCTTDYSQHPRHLAYEQVLESFAAKGIVGLNLLVDHPTEGIWAGATGYADIEKGIALTPCHRHFAASLIKSYIAVIILQLVEEGQLSLDDTLGNYLAAEMLDKLPNGNTATIRQLLQCRSGMPDVFETDFLLDFLNQPTKQYTPEALIRYLYGVKPVAEPGAKFYYGDGNFILLSMLIEQLDGPLPESYQQRIFDRLGLTDSYLIESPEEIPPQLVASYWDRYGKGRLENVSDLQIALTAGLAGTDGLITSLPDLNAFMRGLRTGTLLRPDSYAEMITLLDIPAGDSQQNYAAYGLGMAKVQVSNEVWYGSFGNHVGAAEMMLYNPVHDITLIAAQNQGTFFDDVAKQQFFYELIVAVEAVVFQ